MILLILFSFCLHFCCLDCFTFENLKDIARDLQISWLTIISDFDKMDKYSTIDPDLSVQWIAEKSYAQAYTTWPINGNHILLLDFNQIQDSFEILANSTQHNLIHNSWIVVTNDSMSLQAIKTVSHETFPSKGQLSPFSRIFLVKEDFPGKVVFQMIGNILEGPYFKVGKLLYHWHWHAIVLLLHGIYATRCALF